MSKFFNFTKRACDCLLLSALIQFTLPGQAQKPALKTPEKAASPSIPSENPAQIELLETHIRFEADGSSRKEVHTRVHINSELGARQFAHLNFEYNRAFESIEVPVARITHASGGTVDILPTAISDQPNPAVVNAPAYQDVRRKSVRILGLEPGDVLEYRIITTVNQTPFASDFYLTHDFTHDSVVTCEKFELNLPANRKVNLRTSSDARDYQTEKSSIGVDGRSIYRWNCPPTSQDKGSATPAIPGDAPQSDITLTTFSSWEDLSAAIEKKFHTPGAVPNETAVKVKALTNAAATPEEKLSAVYEYVSQKITTVDLPIGTTGFVVRTPAQIMESGYAIPEEKAILLVNLLRALDAAAQPVFTVDGKSPQSEIPMPSLLSHVLVVAQTGAKTFWLDPSVEVAPVGMIPANLRAKSALLFKSDKNPSIFEKVPDDLPFEAAQTVAVDANIGDDGKLKAKVHYKLRGDNELLLRVAFHKTPKEKWNDLAQLLSLSDGFRGQITSVSASDPYATHDPFTVDYEIATPKFVDWSKHPVRIPALLPQVGLPDPPVKPAAGAATSPIELGTPLDVEEHVTLHLPPGASAHAPTGLSVERDYATFTSHYATKDATFTATRRIRFLLREVSAARASDYNAFIRAVQNDESQEVVLDRNITPPPKANSAAPVTAAPPNTKPVKP